MHHFPAASIPTARRSLATVIAIAALAALPPIAFTAGVVIDATQGKASGSQTVTPVKDGRAVQPHPQVSQSASATGR